MSFLLCLRRSIQMSLPVICRLFNISDQPRTNQGRDSIAQLSPDFRFHCSGVTSEAEDPIPQFVSMTAISTPRTPPQKINQCDRSKPVSQAYKASQIERIHQHQPEQEPILHSRASLADTGPSGQFAMLDRDQEFSPHPIIVGQNHVDAGAVWRRILDRSQENRGLARSLAGQSLQVLLLIFHPATVSHWTRKRLDSQTPVFAGGNA